MGTSARRYVVTGKMDLLWYCVLVVGTFVSCRAYVGLIEAFGSSIVVMLSWWLTRKTTPLFNFKRITIMGFWYVTYLAMIFLPAFSVYDDQQDPYRGRYLFAVHSALITVPLGCLVVSFYQGFRKSETEQFFRAKTLQVSNPKHLRTVYVFLLIPSIFLSMVYISSVDVIPLFYLWRNPGEYLQAALLREDSFKLLDSPFLYAFYVLRSVIFPFLVIMSLGCYLRTRTKLWRNLFVGTLLVALFYCSLSIAKLPVAAIAAVIGFLIYYHRGGLVSRKTVAILLAGVLLFPFAVVLVAYQGSTTFGESTYGILYRLFRVPAENVYYYFEIFPDYHRYLMGRSIDKFAQLVGWVPFNTPRYVGAYVARPGDLETVSFNAAFIADLYADFGMPGVLLGGMVAGAIMQWFHIYAVRRKKTVTTIALYSFLVFTFWILNSSSLPIALASNGALLVIGISWWFDRSATPVSGRIGREGLEPAPS